MKGFPQTLLLFALMPVSWSVLSAAEPAKPNILFAIADDWSFGHAGVYGCKWVKTPTMDRVARDGILFTQAYTPNGKCSPSRASVITGRNPWQLKERAITGPFFHRSSNPTKKRWASRVTLSE